VKRGKRIGENGKEAHWLVSGMKHIIEAFGYEWRTAPGEAEAELAYLNRIGVIDGVLSDDADNFLFGATLVIRNPSATLTGNAAHAANLPTTNHTTVYASAHIETHESVGLTRGGMVLIGLLAGGDYNNGLEGCGMKVAVGIAKCGFGDSLVDACERLVAIKEDGRGGEDDEEGKEALERWLAGWRVEVVKELRTNSMGHLPSKRVALSKVLLAMNSISSPSSSVTSSHGSKKSKSKEAPPSLTFPDLRVLLLYTCPITSETHTACARNRLPLAFSKEPDLGKIAGLCEMYFEWGWRESIIKRFKTLLWDGAVCRILRRAVVEADCNYGRSSPPLCDPPAVPTTPRKHRERREPLITAIHAARTHTSTDGLLEYRLEVAPAQLVRLVTVVFVAHFRFIVILT